MRTNPQLGREQKQFEDRKRRPRVALRNAGRPRSAAIDEAILKAAIKLFVRRGYEGVTLEGVAAAAGVARTTVYRRCLSKEELIARAIAADRGIPESEIVTGSGPAKQLWDRQISGAVTAFSAPKYRNLVARLIGSVPDHPELMSSYWQAILVQRRAKMCEILEQARAQCAIRADVDVEIVLDLIGGAIMYELLVRPGENSAKTLGSYLQKVMRTLNLENR